MREQANVRMDEERTQRVEVGESLKRLFEFSGCQLKRSESGAKGATAMARLKGRWNLKHRILNKCVFSHTKITCLLRLGILQLAPKAASKPRQAFSRGLPIARVRYTSYCTTGASPHPHPTPPHPARSPHYELLSYSLAGYRGALKRFSRVRIKGLPGTISRLGFPKLEQHLKVGRMREILILTRRTGI